MGASIILFRDLREAIRLYSEASTDLSEVRLRIVVLNGEIHWPMPRVFSIIAGIGYACFSPSHRDITMGEQNTVALTLVQSSWIFSALAWVLNFRGAA